MRWTTWLLWGCMGAILGASVWSIADTRADYEVGYFAMLIGLVSGFAVRWKAGENHQGLLPAMAAVVPAVLVMVLAKFVMLQASVEADYHRLVANANMSEEVIEKTIAKVALGLSSNSSLDSATSVSSQGARGLHRENFAPEIWNRAESVYRSYDQSKQTELVLENQPPIAPELLKQLRTNLTRRSFQQKITFYDGLWLVATLAIAGRIGGGITKDDSSL